MENAAIHAADVALSMMRGRSAVLFCGPGNNGGDGLAVARHLHNAGVSVGLVLGAERSRYAGDALINLTICERMGIPALDAANDGAGSEAAQWVRRREPGLIVDALLGTGLERPVREPILGLIRAINDLADDGMPVLAIDIPSGLDADRGEPLGAAVRASVTVTFVGLKAGFGSLAAQPYVGRCRVAGIGVPRELAESLAEAGTPERTPGSDAAGPASRRKPRR